jgi:hypothetical protein
MHHSSAVWCIGDSIMNVTNSKVSDHGAEFCLDFSAESVNVPESTTRVPDIMASHIPDDAVPAIPFFLAAVGFTERAPLFL